MHPIIKSFVPVICWFFYTSSVAEPLLDSSAVEHARKTSPAPAAYLRAVKSQLATPASGIGTLYQGASCNPAGDLLWDETLFRQLSYRLPKLFRRELEQAHYPVPPASATLHLAAEGKLPPYLEIDMSVERASAEVCLQEAGSSGWAALRIHWQVYYAATPSALYESKTEGLYQTAMIENATVIQLFEKAFSLAVRNFLAEHGLSQASQAALNP